MKRVRVDERRHVCVAATEEEAALFLAQMIVEEAQKAIATKASYTLALAGGTTPQKVYEKLQEPTSSLLVNWPFVDLFWSDERCVAASSPESNYGNAIPFFSTPPLDQARKHRMVGESQDLDSAARDYENLLKRVAQGGRLDTVLLGIGEDGHTASLFPRTTALKEKVRLVVPNFVPELQSWRLTLTYPCIQQAKKVIVFALGKTKSKILKKIFKGEFNPEEVPAQQLGTSENPVLYIIDKRAAYGCGL
jgi:6-phosphogluconolactonase